MAEGLDTSQYQITSSQRESRARFLKGCAPSATVRIRGSGHHRDDGRFALPVRFAAWGRSTSWSWRRGAVWPAGELEVAIQVPASDLRVDPPALPDDPAFRLADPALRPGAVPRRRCRCWPWRPADGPPGGVARAAALGRPGPPARPDPGRPWDLRRGLAVCWRSGSPRWSPRVLERPAGPLAAAAGADRPGHAGAGAAPGRLAVSAPTGSSGGARRAAPRHRPARPMSW